MDKQAYNNLVRDKVQLFGNGTERANVYLCATRELTTSLVSGLNFPYGGICFSVVFVVVVVILHVFGQRLTVHCPVHVHPNYIVLLCGVPFAAVAAVVVVVFMFLVLGGMMDNITFDA